MKKILFVAALVFATAFGSCGNRTESSDAIDSTAVDTVMVDTTVVDTTAVAIDTCVCK